MKLPIIFATLSITAFALLTGGCADKGPSEEELARLAELEAQVAELKEQLKTGTRT